MKTSSPADLRTAFCFVFLIFFVALAGAQQAGGLPAVTPYSAASRGPNSTIWERMTISQSPSGNNITNVSHVVELQSGLNYWTGSGYSLSQPGLQASADGQSFVANKLQYNLQIAANLNADGSVRITTPDGIVLQETPIAIALYDPASSNMLFIGAITNCSGTLISSNEVFFDNAFAGVPAGIFYALDRGSFQQSVMFNADIDPGNFGFSTNCILQIFNEFYGAPAPTVTGSVLRFGKLKFGRGRIYTANSSKENGGALIESAWTTVGDRQFLVESVKYSSLQSELQTLPKITMRSVKMGPATRGYAAIPVTHPSEKKVVIKRNQPGIARNGKAPWLAIDFVAVPVDTNLLVLQGDTTYFISGPVVCDNILIEGGAVVKYPNDTTAYIEVDGNLTCQAGPYLMATFTSGDDDSIGQSMQYGPWGGYTGANQPGGYANPALLLANATTLSNVRINCAVTGVEWNREAFGSSALAFNDCQIENCCSALMIPQPGTNGLFYSVVFNNCLLVNNTNLVADDAFEEYENYDFNYCTIDSIGTIVAVDSGYQAQFDAFFPYNSILSAISYYVSETSDPGELGQPQGANNGYYNTPALYDTNSFVDGSNPYQPVGGGNYYLADDTFRGKGNSGLCEIFGTDPSLLADLAGRTTWPPALYDATDISSLDELGPSVPRDTNSSPDLGYHYAALDVLFAGAELSSNLRVTNGTAVGWFYDYDPSSVVDAITLDDGANLSFNGTPTQPCILARTTMVQENGNINWYNSTESADGAITFNGASTGMEPLLFANFTKWTSEGSASQLSDTWADGAGTLKNCEFYNGGLSAYGIQSLDFSNCLFFRSDVGIWDAQYALSFALENSTFYNGGLAYIRGSYDTGLSSSFWLIENTAFDGTAFYWSDYYSGSSSHTLFNYNAYNTNNLNWESYPNFSSVSGANEVVGSQDVMTGDYNWETSWLGNFYLPTNSPLLNKGSTNAGALGLYWFTTQTNQTPQSNNIADIGYHTVATDTNGYPLATLVPPIPNYLLDPSGASNFLTIVGEPVSQTVLQGSNAAFTVTAGGIPAPVYQWYWNGLPLSDGGGVSGSEGATLNLAGAQPNQAGSYYVVVTNVTGSITSSPAVLTVLPSPVGTYPWPQYPLSPYACWNVTDISDPAQPVNIGVLPGPFASPGYNPGFSRPYPLENTLWHSNDMYVTVSNAYGTAPEGGQYQRGTIFQIAMPAGTNFTVIHTFNGTNDGEYPCGQLAISGSTFWDVSNVLYGATSGGGTYGFGTVFRVNAADGSGFTNLYQFTGTNDGKNPATGLLIYGGTLYGTTTNTIFKINTDGSDFTRLANVTNASQLILSVTNDALYGTTSNGGASGCGTIFSVNTDGSGFTNIFTFTNGPAGAYPMSGLELYGIGTSLQYGPSNCTLYGTTYSGGANTDGIVFSINTDGSDFKDLHDFTGTNDGANPVSGLLVTNNQLFNDSGTWLVGTTTVGGTNNAGTIFGMNLDGTGFTKLYDFAPNLVGGAHPLGKLACIGPVLYGTTSTGGTNDFGSLFSINNDGTGFTNLYSFKIGSSGGSPLAGLALPVVDNEASIWSLETTVNVPSAEVSNLVYSIAIDDDCILLVNGAFVNWTNSSINGVGQWETNFSLPNLHPGKNDIRVIIGGDNDHNDYFGMNIESPATNPFSQNVFGTTLNGGIYGHGTAFEIAPGGNEVWLHLFTNSDGTFPIGNLVLSGGTLYGVAQNGGVNGYGNGNGVIFSISTNGSNYQVLHEFTLTNAFDGANPAAGLILVENNLYGTTEYGGLNAASGVSNEGTIFSIGTNGSDYRVLYSFGTVSNDGSSDDGENPEASLVLVGTNLYGTASAGGAAGSIYGTIFGISTNGTGYTNLYNFGGSPDGANPIAELTASGDTLYGTTESGGDANGDGTIFSFNISTKDEEILHTFTNQPDGAGPQAGLALSGGTLYGTTHKGGLYDGGEGTIFSIGTNGTGYVVLQSFGASDSYYGEHPEADLLVLGNWLYGTTYYGGGSFGDGPSMAGYGMVFAINISTNGAEFYDNYDFFNNDGANPEGGLSFP